MAGYILSILGIVMVGVLVDIIIPTGTINKYIKSIYGIFVLAVLINPVISMVSKISGYELSYSEYSADEGLLNYIYSNHVISLQNSIISTLTDNGFSNIDIKINYVIENNSLCLNSCEINLENLEIASDKLHINKYEYIVEVVNEIANLDEEVIVFYE